MRWEQRRHCLVSKGPVPSGRVRGRHRRSVSTCGRTGSYTLSATKRNHLSGGKSSGAPAASSRLSAGLSRFPLGPVSRPLSPRLPPPPRYSTDPRWHVPHFEKMMYDQSQLVTAYVEAFQVGGDAASCSPANRLRFPVVSPFRRRFPRRSLAAGYPSTHVLARIDGRRRAADQVRLL